VSATGKPLPEGVVELERRIAAPAEIVFAYFIDAERHSLWQGIDAELDPRPGGIFRVTMNDIGQVLGDDPGRLVVARGLFLEVEPPTRLVFSWGWEGIDGLPPGESTVEVKLVPEGDSTLLRLRHSGLPSELACQIHAYGWGVGLDSLVVVAASGD
jgi:uncharacterized protein YndB with AHSA1/START domain